MPRQKFCSVPGCVSNTDSIKLEQEVYLSTFCRQCSTGRPCRCPSPDIFTTRRETRNKFTAWCNAIGLTSPGYYVNVCYKHFSAGCPTRQCPNPDLIKTNDALIGKQAGLNSVRAIKITSPFSSKTTLKTSASITTPTPAPTPTPTSTGLPITLPTVPIPKEDLEEFSSNLPPSPPISDDLSPPDVDLIDLDDGFDADQLSRGFQMFEDFLPEPEICENEKQQLLREESHDPCLNDGFGSARSRTSPRSLDSIQTWLDQDFHPALTSS